MKHFITSNLVLILTLLFFVFTAKAQPPAFPQAQGFGAYQTSGGRGGQVLYVTNLNCSGPGSLNAALATPGVRYILFKVSGIIDCAAEIVYGNCYIAGQTSPGGIMVRGIIADDWYEPAGSAQNIIVRHLTSRPATATVRPGTGWVADDAMRLDAARNVVIDHCSFANATDESIQISRSSNITLQYCMLAETLGSHFDYGGLLMNYSVANHRLDSITIHHCLWNRIGGRLPEISCEISAEASSDMDCFNTLRRYEISNNLFWDLPIQMWYGSDNPDVPNHTLQINLINNHAVARNAYHGPFFNHAFLDHTPNQIFASGNTMNLYPALSDYQLFYCCNDFNQFYPNTDLGSASLLSARLPYPTISYTPTAELTNHLLCNVGAFNNHSPNRRNTMDRRLLQALQNGAINSNPVNGNDYFNDAFTLDFTVAPAAPQDTDNDGMPDVWESAHGLNPSVQDHNLTNLSVALTGFSGYTNLECYLNRLAATLSGAAPIISGPTAVCGSVISNYSVSEQTGAVYLWTVTGGNIISGQGTHTVQVQWTSAVGCNIQVAVLE
ncbi:MAG TPA: hypothetical protein PK239_03290 [Chitinophagales bacterium]|nr:hypothetical protein [Chitinophagales bacterium]HRK26295.1 hypothetical protein [Chitinophagales bacterium]